MFIKLTRITSSILTLGLALALSLFPHTAATAQDGDATIRLLRTLDTDNTGPLNPVGLAYSEQANAFFVIQERAGATALLPDTDVLALDPFAEPVASPKIAAAVEDPINTAYDNRYDRLLIYQPDSGQLLESGGELLDASQASAVSHDLSALAIADPQGLAVDGASGVVFILDAAGPRIVRLAPAAGGDLGNAAVSEIDLGPSGLTALRGIAFDPGSGHLHVYSLADQNLYELSDSGALLASRSLVSFGLRNPQAILFAPSGDQTDDPAAMSLFLADSGQIDGRARLPGSPQGLSSAATMGTGQIMELSLAPAPSAAPGAFVSTLIQTTDFSTISPPSPDPTGVFYLPLSNSLIMVDSEVEEVVNGITHFEGANLWELTLGGTVTRSANISKIAPTVTPLTNEPTDIAWNPTNGHYFVIDDNGKKVFDLNPGADGLIGTADDTWTYFLVNIGAGNNDPEGITYNPWNNHVYVADGVSREVYEYTLAGALVSQFDVQVYGVDNPEGIAFNPVSGTLFVASGSEYTPVIVETTTSGALLQTIDISSIPPRSIGGIAYGPASNGSGVKRFYLVDRGVDNNFNWEIIDGRMYEISAPVPASPSNNPPTVSAGTDQAITLPATLVNLDGTVSDDGKPTPPGAVSVTWSQISGPGAVMFGDTHAVDTTASFPAGGSYVLQLAASDGEFTPVDQVTITVNPDPTIPVLTIPVAASSDDAEESAAGNLDLVSPDLDLVYEFGNQKVGMRFNNVTVPQGKAIRRAYVQFTVDFPTSDATSLTVRGENVDNSTTFVAVRYDISSRLKTVEYVPWDPAPWVTIGDAGIDQQTPDLKKVIQEIVDRSGWASGNSLSIFITGTGVRVAESYDGTAAPQLHLEYYAGTTPSGCYSLTRNYSGTGSAPTASPAYSTGCEWGKYTAGQSITLTAYPGTEFRVGSWSGTTNNASTSTTNTVTMPASNHTVTANYVPVCYTLTRAFAGTGSAPTASPANSTGCPAGQYTSGQSISMTAAPGVGYSVGSWSGTVNDASTSSTNTVSMPSGNHTVSANYVAICYTLTRSHTGTGSNPTASPANSSGCAAGKYTVGQSITMTAAPGSGYMVGSWTGTTNNTSVSTTNTVSMPASNHTVGANYVAIRPDTTGVFRPGNGLLYLKNANTTGFADIAINYGLGGDYPVTGDWNGDGIDTIGIYRNGSFYLRNSNTIGFADLVFPFGSPGDQPIAGDWNADGIDTIGVYRPSTGQFLLRNSNTAGPAEMSFYLGNVGDVGIAGDWDGDGVDTTGVFRPSNGVIFLKNTNSTGFADIALNYGLPGDRPVMGDWNADGIDTIGIYRNGIFYLRNSNTVGFADIVFGLGNPGDMPIAGDWDGLP